MCSTYPHINLTTGPCLGCTKQMLSDELAENFPLVQNAADLLDAMASHPRFGGGNPSDNLLSFLTWIETADPNSTDFSEDDTNASWGHSQFTTGNLTWSTVLISWSDVGNCGVACQLIAAAIKTCKVARHLCFERQILPGSYLSNIYLEQIVEVLWRLWKDAGGVSNSIMFISPSTNILCSQS